MKRAYLDYNAGAPLRPEASAAMAAVETGNPSSVHHEGRTARALVEAARRQVAALISAGDGARVVFTSGGTEACRMAAESGGRVPACATEHAAVLESDASIALLPVRADGLLDLDALDEALGDAQLVCIQLANNETGVLQPIAEIAARCRARGARLFCDAVQAAGKLPLDFDALGCDMLALSAHKLGGPMGVGALVMREGALPPSGGAQEYGFRAGTENVAGIVGFGAAAEAAHDALADFARLAEWRNDMEIALCAQRPDCVIFGAGAPRLPNTSCFSASGLDAETLLMALDLDGFAVSAGAACTSGKVAASHVLAAMGVGEDLSRGALRVSLGWDTQADEPARLVESWARVACRAPAAAE